MGIAGSRLFYPNKNIYTGCPNGQPKCFITDKLTCYFDGGSSFFGMCLLEGFLNTVVGVVILLAVGFIIGGTVYVFFKCVKNLKETCLNNARDGESQSLIN